MEKNILEEHKIVPLTPEQARERIKAAAKTANDEDQEQGHMDADDALCGLLVHLGYTDIVEQYLEIPKWYA